MKAYFGYVRVSTTEQGKGASPAEQRRAITEYASRNGLPIVDWFEEHATAAKLGRKQFTRMLAELDAGRASGIIIHKIDRSARNLKDWVQLNELVDRGVDVRFVQEGLDFKSRAGRLTGDILAVVAADFIRNNRDEVLKGFYGRLNQGLYPMAAPLGYVDRGKGKPKEIDPKVGPLVRQMFELYGTGHYSLWTLRAEMKRRGLRSKVGKPLSVDATGRILRNPFYIGIIKLIRRKECFPGIHQPLITKRLFDRVQLISSGRRPTQLQKHEFAFRHLITCVVCGRSLYGERQKGHVYYRCHTRCCRGTSLRESHIDERLGSMFSAISLDDGELRDLRDIAQADDADGAKAEQERQVRLKQALTLADDRLVRLTDAFLDASIDKDAFQGRKEKLLSEKRELLDALESPEERENGRDLFEKLELANMAQVGFETLLSLEKRQLVETVISNLTAEGKELGIRLQFPFDVIATERNFDLGAPRQGTSRNGSTRTERGAVAVRGKSWSRQRLKRLYFKLKNLQPKDPPPRVPASVRSLGVYGRPTKTVTPARRPHHRPVPAKRHARGTGGGARGSEELRAGPRIDRRKDHGGAEGS